MDRIDAIEAPDRQRILAALRAQRDRLIRFGILHVDLVGSVARGEAEARSDIDLAITFGGPYRRYGFDHIAMLEDLRADLAALLGRSVDVIANPPQRPALAAEFKRDAIRAF